MNLKKASREFKKFEKRIITVIQSQKKLIRTISIFFFVGLLVIFVLTLSLSYINANFAKKHIDKSHIKNLTKHLIASKSKKAIDIGIMDFSILEGISFEDFRISLEEDFASNKFLFVSKKILLKFSSIFDKNPYLKKIIIYDSKISIDIDDPLADSLMDYFQNFSLSEITLKNTEIVITQNGKILFSTDKPIYLNFKKEKNFVLLEFTDNILLGGNIFSNFYGNGKVDLDKKTFHISSRLQHFPAKNMEGLSSALTGIIPESGTIHSSFEITKDPNSLKIYGIVELNRITGIIDFYKEIRIKDLSLKENFQFVKNTTMVKSVPKVDYSSKREISSDFFHLNLEKSFSPDKLIKTKLTLNATDLSKFSETINTFDNLKIEGGFVLKAESSETGNENNWFKNDVVFSTLGLNLVSKNSGKFDLKITNANLLMTDKGDLNLELNGTSFGKKFFSKINGKTVFSKIKDRYGKLFYPIQSDSKIQFQFEDISLSDYTPVFDEIKKIVQSDIKERQEKMVSESYLVQSPTYKLFFEKMKCSFELIFQNVKFRNDNVQLGKFDIKGDLNNGMLSVSVNGGIADMNASSASLRANFNTKSPYMDMKVKTGNIFWFDEAIQFCGVKLYSDMVNLEFSVISSGNNFWDFIITRQITGSMSFRNSSIQQGKIVENKISSLPFLLDKNVFSFSYDFDIYSLDGYKRKIELKGDEFILNGYSQIKNDTENYSFSGFYKKIPVFYSVSDTGESCLKR